MQNPGPEQIPDYASMYPDGSPFPGLTAEQIIAIDNMARQMFQARGGVPLRVTELPPSELLQECKTVCLAGTVSALEEPPSHPAPNSRGLFGDLATPSPAALADHESQGEPDPPCSVTPNMGNPATIMGGIIPPNFLREPTQTVDSGLGTPEQGQRRGNSGVPSPNTLIVDLFADPVSESSNVAPSLGSPAAEEIEPMASPRTWAQIASGHPMTSAGNPPAHHSGTDEFSTTPGDTRTRSKLGSPFLPTNLRKRGLNVPQPRSAVEPAKQNLMPSLDTPSSGVPLGSTAGPGANQGPESTRHSAGTQRSDVAAQIGKPGSTIPRESKDPLQLTHPQMRPTEGHVRAREEPLASLEPIEGISFTQRHCNPRIRTFAPEGGLERLNTTMQAVSVQEHARGRSLSPPSVDLSAPSSGRFNIRTGLDSLNEFNENYAHHVRGAIREAGSISGAPIRPVNSGIARSNSRHNSGSSVTGAAADLRRKSPTSKDSGATRFILNLELYGTMTTHENGQKLWKCKSCEECPPLLADNHAGRGWIAKHINGHLKGQSHDHIPREIAPGTPVQQSEARNEQKSSNSIPHGRHGAVQRIQARAEPPRLSQTSTQSNLAGPHECAVARGYTKPGPTDSNSETENMDSFRFQPLAHGCSPPGAQANVASMDLLQPSSPEAVHFTDTQSQWYRKNADTEEPSRQLRRQGSHSSEKGSRGNLIKLDDPGQQMEMSEVPLSNLVSDFDRIGYARVPSATFTHFGVATTASLQEPASAMNKLVRDQGMDDASPPTPRPQPPEWLLNTAAPGISDRGTPPAVNLGEGIVGHFHSGGYFAPVSPGPFPYEGYIGPGAFGTPELEAARRPERYVGIFNVTPSPQASADIFREGPEVLFYHTANIQQLPEMDADFQPIPQTGRHFGEPSTVDEFYCETPLPPVLSSNEQQQLIDAFMQGNNGSEAEGSC